jgi:hypothetical protein
MPLILHCGAQAVKRKHLAEVHTPKLTRTWVPLPHESLLKMVEQGLAAEGLEIVEEAHGLSHAGKRYFGLLEVRRGDPKQISSWVVGLRNSHDQKFCAGVVAGARVLVCDNLSFSGDIKLEHKHTRNMESHLAERMPLAVKRLNLYWGRYETRITCYQDYQMADITAHDLIIRSVDADVCSNRLVPSVLEEWRNPRHEEFAPRTAWSLFNAFTEVLKGNLFELPRRTDRLHHLFDAQVGFNANSLDASLLS